MSRANFVPPTPYLLRRAAASYNAANVLTF